MQVEDVMSGLSDILGLRVSADEDMLRLEGLAAESETAE